MRLFIALEPGKAFREALKRTQALLASAGVSGRFSRVEDMHLTLAFIGEWPEDISWCLPEVAEPFELTLDHLGVFPKAKVLWAGIKPSEELERLAKAARKNLDAAGIPYDPKPFNPHITLVRKPVFIGGALPKINVQKAVMTVRGTCLYQSAREEGGVRYRVIGRKYN